MRCATHSITPDSIHEDSERARQHIEDVLCSAEKLRLDSEKQQRLSEHHCRRCHYLRKVRIGGAAITERDCGACGTLMQFGSTATDVMCTPCAQEKHLCKQCGARLDI